MKFKFTFQEINYMVEIIFGNSVTTCNLVCEENGDVVAEGKAKRCPTDSPNWLVARKVAFEYMMKDAELYHNFSPELRRIAWLHFVDVVKGKL